MIGVPVKDGSSTRISDWLKATESLLYADERDYLADIGSRGKYYAHDTEMAKDRARKAGIASGIARRKAKAEDPNLADSGPEKSEETDPDIRGKP